MSEFNQTILVCSLTSISVCLIVITRYLVPYLVYRAQYLPIEGEDLNKMKYTLIQGFNRMYREENTKLLEFKKEMEDKHCAVCGAKCISKKENV